MKQVFKIDGMSCKHCVARVEEGLNSLAGIDKVKINLKKGEGKVTFNEAEVTADDIIAKIKETGYEAEVK
ncbi:copper chaperone CopZ [Vagococcus acidifermentans]|uniref:Copper chaperone CopZ n=1 Tax=Vagococcus acidifermentans TaxID=564710 RepID=A0A430B0V7_9ENTE|nr:copper chaperone CopZ [Vagococcus acidifermentans]RSU13936.1 copper-binding protein [Vagococcus acidifermentans]